MWVKWELILKKLLNRGSFRVLELHRSSPMHSHIVTFRGQPLSVQSRALNRKWMSFPALAKKHCWSMTFKSNPWGEESGFPTLGKMSWLRAQGLGEIRVTKVVLHGQREGREAGLLGFTPETRAKARHEAGSKRLHHWFAVKLRMFPAKPAKQTGLLLPIGIFLIL